jgi:Tol biopolymer transport system component
MGSPGGRIAPESLDQLVPSDDIVRVQDQHREESALLRACGSEIATVIENLEWAEDPKLHVCIVARVSGALAARHRRVSRSGNRLLSDKGGAVDETYWMLGREHQADLEREAQRRDLAAAARAASRAPTQASAKPRWRSGWDPFVSRLAARCMNRIALLLSLLAAIVIASLVAAVRPAQATYPGSNGKIAFHSNEAGNQDIWTMNPDGTGKTNLTANSAAADVTADWSPDGQKIAFVSRRDGGNREIYVMEASGSNQTRLTDNPARDVLPSWSPNGKKILFASDRDGDPEIYLIDADGTKVRQLTHNSAIDSSPEFSPNGEKILFESDRGGAPAVYVMTADGTGARQLTADEFGAFAPDWSPGGKEVALANNCCVNENSDIFVMGANGKGVRQLTQGFDNNTDPSWSPDGQKIVFDHGVVDFTTEEFFPTDLYVMNSDGTGLTQLTSTPTIFEFFPDWGPG